MEMWFSEFHTKDVKHSLRVSRHLYAKKSSYQQIDIFETPEFGRVLVLDGNVMLTERDEFIYDEMITHVPMAVHPGIRDVLVIGAGAGGVRSGVSLQSCAGRLPQNHIREAPVLRGTQNCPPGVLLRRALLCGFRSGNGRLQAAWVRP